MLIATIALITLMPPLSGRAADFARIYVYSQRETVTRSWLPISCDSAVVARLKRGTFFVVKVAPGRHVLSDEKGVPVFVDVRSGEESFVRLDWNFEMGRTPISELHAVRPSEARKEMINLAYIDAGKVLSTSVPKTDPRELLEPRLKRRDANE